MAQWEYQTINLSDVRRKADDMLNDAGELGWQLVFITVNGIAYLKREVGASASSGRHRKTAQPGIA